VLEVGHIHRGPWSQRYWSSTGNWPPRNIIMLTVPSREATLYATDILWNPPPVMIRLPVSRLIHGAGCRFHHAYPVGYKAAKHHFDRDYVMQVDEGEYGPEFKVDSRHTHTHTHTLIPTFVRI
jgi:hypothetical protein